MSDRMADWVMFTMAIAVGVFLSRLFGAIFLLLLAGLTKLFG